MTSSLVNPSRFSAPEGQAATQAPQALHSERSTRATRCPPSVGLKSITPALQVVAHTPHPEHTSSFTAAPGPNLDGLILRARAMDMASWSMALEVALSTSSEWIQAT
ncbi:MAG: hypothetical protein A4E29_00612 [Methanomassiliicoccales archaeon PtaB.Bin134]|nr:MAG: hypothetical protein A4E29_00612 [Methanomassiliicoccales archaeon PtaB.Bin134]